MPPGHAKSRYASVLFPSYYLGRYPNKNLLMITHTQGFSNKWGRFCKRILLEPKYQYLMETELRRDSQSSSEFGLNNGSEYFGSGIQGNITGQRGDIIIIDDPIRGIADADSLTIREKIWDAWTFDIRSRISPNASKVIVATRWHEDDLIGRVLNSSDSKNWEVISLPAIAEEDDPLGRQIGEALWPDYIPIHMLLNEKTTRDKEDIRSWNSLYQQRPTAEDGYYFRKEWIKRINKIPYGLNYYGASDYAVSEGKGDYTVHIVVGHDPKRDDIYIVDVWRKRSISDEWINAFIDLSYDYEPLMWGEESGQIIKSLDPIIIKEMRRNNHFVFRQQFPSLTDKTSRCRSFQAYMAAGRVFIKDADWTDDLVREMLSFPSGKHDDQVDALSLIGRMLYDMMVIKKKKIPKSLFGFKDNQIILPGIHEKIKPKQQQPLFKKF
jgi:predicted phage terminase large subunit-like protein